MLHGEYWPKELANEKHEERTEKPPAISAFCLLTSVFPLVFTCAALAGEPAPREKTVFKADMSTLTVGRDGKVYLCSTDNNAIVLRMNRDGSDRRTGPGFAAPRNVAANAVGMMAMAIPGQLILSDPDFYVLWAMDKIYSGFESVGVAAPAHVEAGTGDFYAADQYRDRIIRCNAFGKRLGFWNVPREPAGPTGEIRDFRVCENTGTLYVLTSDSVIRCFEASGKDWSINAKKLWSIPSGVVWGETRDGGGSGGFDVDDDGVLYATDGKGEIIKRYALDGKAMPDLKLHVPANLRPADRGFHTLRIADGEAILKRVHSTEFFQRYDLATGALKNIADLNDAEKTPPPLRVLFLGNSQIWTGCGNIPAIIEELSHTQKDGVRRIEASEVVLPGAALKDVWQQAEGVHKILNGQYDWVVIHESVFQPNKEEMFEYTRKFHSMAMLGGKKLLIFATGDLENKRGNHKVMHDNALQMARELHCSVAGGGMAWLKAWETDPKLDLHHTDRAHPNVKGYYLNACVIYSVITGLTPVGLDPFTLSKSEAEFLQGIAWEQAQEDRRNAE